MAIKVLMVTPYFVPILNGVSFYVYRLAKGLMSENVYVEVHTVDCKEEDNDVDDINLIGLNIRRMKCFWDKRELCQPLSFSYIFRTLAVADDFDIIHIHDFPKVINDLLVFFLKKVKRIKTPVVLTPHGSGYVGPSGNNISRIYWFIGFPFYILNASDAIITGTNIQYENFKRVYGPKKTHLIYTGLLTREYFDNDETNDYAKDKDESFKILYIGRIIQEKGLQHLYRAISEATKYGINVKLICVGPDYGYKKDLEILSEKLGISSLINYTGKISEVEKHKYLRWCNALVLPSYYEAFGIPIVEAMAYGKAVIATATEGAKSLIEDHKDGLLVKIGSDLDLYLAIKELAENPDYCKNMGYDGRQRAAIYKIDTFIEKHIELYHELLNSSASK